MVCKYLHAKLHGRESQPHMEVIWRNIMGIHHELRGLRYGEKCIDHDKDGESQGNNLFLLRLTYLFVFVLWFAYLAAK